MGNHKPPYLFLDVDGVVSPLTRRARKEWPDLKSSRARCEGELSSLLLSRSMGEALRELEADIRWATSWGHQANEHVGKPIGLPERPVAAYPPTLDKRRNNWKYEQVRATVEIDPRPFCWVEDVRFTQEVRDWAASCQIPNLLLVVDGASGISSTDIGTIELFIAETAMWTPEEMNETCR